MFGTTDMWSVVAAGFGGSASGSYVCDADMPPEI